MRSALIALVLFPTLFASSGSLWAADIAACADKVPTWVLQDVQARFPAWHARQLADFDSDDQGVWLQEHGNKCPGFFPGHFEPTASLSCAILLIPRSASQQGYKLIVLTKFEAKKHVRVLAKSDTAGRDETAISKTAPGKYVGFDSTRSVSTRLDGIELEWLEKSSVIYYWSKGAFHGLETSD